MAWRAGAGRAVVRVVSALYSYRIGVLYRTATTCSGVTVEVAAPNADEAFRLAHIKARNQRKGLVRIDGGYVIGQPQLLEGMKP